MQKTTNLQLNKPDYDDVADIADINENMDIIDEAIGNKSDSGHTHTLTGNDIVGILPIAKGGTGATTASAARTNLGLGTAATKAYTTSVTSGSTSLITSGAVYKVMSDVETATEEKADKNTVIPCYYAISEGTDFTINVDRDLSPGDLFFVKFSTDAIMGIEGQLHIVYDGTTINGLMCGFDQEKLNEIKSDTVYLATYDNKNNALLQNMIADSTLDDSSTNAVENKVITARLKNIEKRLAALEGAN